MENDLDGEKERRRSLAIGRLQQRENERLERVAARQSRVAEHQAPSESVATFINAFAEFENAMRNENLDRSKLKQFNRKALSEELQSTSEKCSVMQKKLAQASFFLPPYDQRKCQVVLDEFAKTIIDLRGELLPRQKFSFGDHQKRAPQKLVETGEAVQFSNFKSSEVLLTALPGETIHKVAGEVNGADMRLSHLDNVTIYICDRVGALRIDHLSNCRIFVGPVDSSVLLDSCSNCEFAFASRQVRIHHAQNCDFYLLVASNPIIEHSHGVRLAPYSSFLYPDIATHLEQSGLCGIVNRGMQAKDFQWLNPDEPSPNWCIIPVEERIKSYDSELKI